MPNEIETEEVESEIEVGDDAGDLDEEEAEEGQEASDDDSDEGGEPKPKPKPDPKPAPRTYKAKANGKEIDVPAEHVEALASILGVDPNEIVRGSQMLRSGQEKLRAAAEAERKAKALEESAKKDPIAALRQAGLSDAELQKATIAYVARLYEEEQLRQQNPTEYEKRQLQEQLRQRDEQDKQRQAEAEEQESVRYREQATTKVDAEIRELLEAGKIPAHPYAVKRIASHMLDMTSKGIDPDDISAADFVPVVLDDMKKDVETFLGSLSGEDVIRLFPELSEKVRKAHVSKAAPRRAPVVATGERPQRPPARKLTPREVLESFVKG
jgi:hypothetical protein